VSRSRVRLREALRAPVETTDPAALAAYAKQLRPVVATIRELAEDATAAKPVYSREHCREQILKAIRVVETRLDVAAPPEHGDPAGCGSSPTY
jgi:hypothetical protein